MSEYKASLEEVYLKDSKSVQFTCDDTRRIRRASPPRFEDCSIANCGVKDSFF